MPKYYARTFLPWIMLAVVSSFDTQAGAITGLVAAVALLGQDLRRGNSADALVLEISTSAFMALLTALAFTMPGSSVLDYGASLAIGWLAATAWGTLLLRRPFTEGIARRQVPAEIAATGLFRRVNRVITAVWAVSFTALAAALGLVQHWDPDDTALLVAVKVAGFTVPAVFTARYPGLARKRHLAGSGLPFPEASTAEPEPAPR